MTAPTLSALLLAESHAAYLESIHQSVCRARAADLGCATCLDLEAAWMRADDALTAFQRELARAS